MQPRDIETDNNYGFLKQCNPCMSAESLAHDGQEDSAGQSETPTRWWLQLALWRT